MRAEGGKDLDASAYEMMQFREAGTRGFSAECSCRRIFIQHK